MIKLNIAVVIVALVALCSCSGQSSPDLQTDRHAATPVTISDGWNANAYELNFALAYSEFTLGQLYKGQNFETDMRAMEAAVRQYYGLSGTREIGVEAMGFAHFDDEIID